SERRLARALSIGLPTVTVCAALIAGVAFGLPQAILVLGGGAFLAVIAFFLASVRTLSGDAPLPAEIGMLAAQTPTVDAAAERKRTLLRALKDLEHEHAIGKMDDEDYKDVAARYREEAKAVMREMDEAIEPLRQKAEELAREHLRQKRLLQEDPGDKSPSKAG